MKSLSIMTGVSILLDIMLFQKPLDPFVEAIENIGYKSCD